MLRRILEDLDYCSNYETQHHLGNIVIMFYYRQPVDSVIWTLEENFFDTYLKVIFETANSKRRKVNGAA
ncbi:MAG: hypothetical protein IPM96_16055 [Ignavibacteria bacterium]|nr:hypothetical protein [Ignavibacteria bacterium]